MEPADIEAYLREVHRLLKPNGRVFLTAFVEEDVTDLTINPADYRVPIAGELHVARYEYQFLTELFEAAGFSVSWFDYGLELCGHSVLHLSKQSRF